MRAGASYVPHPVLKILIFRYFFLSLFFGLENSGCDIVKFLRVGISHLVFNISVDLDNVLIVFGVFGEKLRNLKIIPFIQIYRNVSGIVPVAIYGTIKIWSPFFYYFIKHVLKPDQKVKKKSTVINFFEKKIGRTIYVQVTYLIN